MTYDLRLGRYQDVCVDLEVDSTLADPPYSKRTHEGASSEQIVNAPYGASREAVTYDFWTPDDVLEYVRFWHERTRFWIGAMTSHDLIGAWEEAYAQVGRYHFAPVPIVCSNPVPRVCADGPTSSTVYLMVARPMTALASAWRSLPGDYRYTRKTGEGGGGRGKPDELLRKIVRDYTNLGFHVCDPTAGRGSTLEAALRRGCRASGAEMDPAVYAEARTRLDRVQVVDLFDPMRSAKQANLSF